MKLRMLACFLLGIFAFSAVFAADIKNKRNMEIVKILNEQKRGTTRSVVRNSQAKSAGSESKAMWNKISVLYMSAPEWADEVQVKLYVLCFNKNGGKNARSSRDLFTLLSGSVKYINVSASKENRAELFIHPDTTGRFGDIVEIRAEIWYKGMMESYAAESYASKKQQEMYGRQWWTQFSPRDGELLNRYYTPFEHDPDNAFENIKLN